MRIIKYPQKDVWEELTKRPHLDLSTLTKTVQKILYDVKTRGDEAIKEYEEQFDHANLDSLLVTENEFEEAEKLISDDLRLSLIQAHHNISTFHRAQLFEGKKIETAPGVVCWQKSLPIEKVGLYIPGGSAPLFSSLLMLATPARIAGCREIILCTPPNKDGKIHPAILSAAKIAGVRKIFKIGGVQAIGAMAYGTSTVPQVYKIFGPGNQYVMAAKQQVSLHDVAIDMPAGPSEVCVLADEFSNPTFIAADLLSQAEHGPDSQVFLISTSELLADNVNHELLSQLEKLPRKEIAQKALDNSKTVVVKNTSEAIELANLYAPEHLIIATADYNDLADKVINAGSVFLGQYACESAGDYASGTNHTLPTHGYATTYNGVNLDSFCKKITFQHLTDKGIESIGKTVVCMAENEQLEAHANAMRLRMKH